MCSLSVGFIDTKSAVGVLKLTCCEKGVHEIEFTNKYRAPDIGQNKSKKSKINHDVDTGPLLDLKHWISCYFNACPISHPAPIICPVLFYSKGKFTQNVWVALVSNIEAGHTISYSGLARLAGNASASRAVGLVMKHNPIPILIPCHRVIKNDGTMGHYSGGDSIKSLLLDHENSMEVLPTFNLTFEKKR